MQRMFAGLLLMFVEKLTLTSFNQHEAEPVKHEWHQMAAKEKVCHIIQRKAKQHCTLKQPRWGVKPPSGMLASGFSGDGRGLLD